MAKQVQIYSAESKVRRVPDVLRSMVSGAMRSRYMAYRLCMKDIRAEYSRSALGIVWDFLDPLVLGIVFYFLKRVSVVNPGEMATPYAVFIIYGLLMYQTFSESALLSVDVMRRFRNILTHLKVPPEALILAVFFRVLFNSGFRIVVMLIFSLALHLNAIEQGLTAFSLVGFAKFLVCYPLLILAGMSIGVFLAPFNVIYGDVGRFVRIVLLPLRYVSPVLWAIPRTSLLYVLNPISVIMTNLRLFATSDQSWNLPGMGIRCAGFALLFMLGWFVFHVSVPILAEKA